MIPGSIKKPSYELKPTGRENPLDVQVGGDHYQDFKIQPIEFIERNKLGFSEGNVIKYVCRHKSKNGIEDLKKARHYIDLCIKFNYGEDDELQK